MKRILLFLLISFMCSSSLLFAADKWGVELSPHASIPDFIYSTDFYNVGGYINFFKNGSDNQTPTNQYVEVFVFGDLKNKIDEKSSWAYGLNLYTLMGRCDGKKVDYDYYFAPYLKYEYSFTKNILFEVYFNLIELEYIKYENEDVFKIVEAFRSDWYVAFYF